MLLLEREYHLDDPLAVRYVRWLGDFARGRWGTSYDSRRPVAAMIGPAMASTLLLSGAAIVVSLAAGVGLGVLGATRKGSVLDHCTNAFAYFGLSMPVFWFGLILQLGLVIVPREALGVQVLYSQGKYSTGREGDLLNLLQHMVLPVLTLSIGFVAIYSRFQRASLIEALGADYVRTAKAKGASARRVVCLHALRNALGPVVTVTAVGMGGFVGGAVVTERVFSWPGMGTLFLQALNHHDYPVVLSWMAIVAVAVVVANLVADIVYCLLDPRIRLA